ncbi:hypothetical protein L211DRAFT_845148 [Terfezia boudieri ATCC MYA-4762]|uniref:Uncharacterized protein n=1 Tax=Terfezia boudieri ATCC MYA-4762 TaxID=1051890 RepID=A0A3N4MM50_9PEZI|nr:hypothetical protein L211DRAFT_845148 [Terfezia boudieri ATCC MYA-4762]
MDTWPTSPKATPSLSGPECEADMSQQLRTLSETAVWYDEALFSPAITVPRANTSNVDWYGGSLWQGSSLDFYHLPPPYQVMASAPISSSFGILLPGHIFISAKSEDSSPGHYLNTSNWTNLNLPFAQTHNMQNPYIFPTTTPQQPVQLLTTLACLNSNFEPGAMNFNTQSSLQQTSYIAPFEAPFLQLPYEPSTSDTHENSEELRRIWATLFNGMNEENVSWMNSQSNGISEEGRSEAYNWSVNASMVGGEGGLGCVFGVTGVTGTCINIDKHGTFCGEQ